MQLKPFYSYYCIVMYWCFSIYLLISFAADEHLGNFWAIKNSAVRLTSDHLFSLSVIYHLSPGSIHNKCVIGTTGSA